RAPFSGRIVTRDRISVSKHPGIGFDWPQMPKPLRNGIDEAFPLLREYAPHVLGDPLNLTMRGRCNESKDHCVDPMGVSLRIGEREGAAPRDAKNGPPIDAAEFTDGLDIGYQMLCCVGAEIGVGVACRRPAAT